MEKISINLLEDVLPSTIDIDNFFDGDDFFDSTDNESPKTKDSSQSLFDAIESLNLDEDDDDDDVNEQEKTSQLPLFMVNSIDEILEYEEIDDLEDLENRAARLKGFFSNKLDISQILKVDSLDLLLEDDDIEEEEEIDDKDHLTKEEMEEVAESCMGLVYSIAGSFTNVDPSLNDELIVVGLEGLYKGLKGFDKKREFKYSTYLVPCIRRAMINFLEKYQKDGLSQSISFEEAFASSFDENEKTSKVDTIQFGPTKELSFDEMIITKERCRKIRECLDILTDDEKFVIIHSFGINSEDEFSQEQLSIILNVTQPVISCLKKKALTKLKKIILQLKLSKKW